MEVLLRAIIYHCAEVEMPCQACDMFWSMERPIDYKGIDCSDILLFYKAKHGKIRKGERYIQFVFVDEWGEQFEFNALPSMHKFMFRMGFYPEFLNESMLQYRKEVRIKKAMSLQ